MAKRVKIGDVVEIVTSRGMAYSQVSHIKKRWGSLLRVLPGFFHERPMDFSEIVQRKEDFVTFFPLQAAVSRSVVEIVGNEEVPPRARVFPLFRNPGSIDREGRIHDWWLWDGEREWQVGKLKRSQLKLPILGVMNDTLLIERIEEGWKPENQPADQA